MIVWDSREAEERNARGLLAERSRAVWKARRQLRWRTVHPWLWGLFAVFEIWQLYAFLHHLDEPLWRTLLAVAGLALGLYGLRLARVGRRLMLEVIPFHERRLRDAQEVHDRVFGGQP